MAEDIYMVKRFELALDFKGAASKDAQLLTQEGVGLLKTYLLPKLALALPKLRSAFDGKYLFIPRLEIDLGKLSVGQFRSELVTTIVQQLQEQLLKVNDDDFQQQGTKAVSDDRAFTQTTIQQYGASLVHFLEFGTLPLWCKVQSWEAFEQQLLNQLRTGSSAEVEQLVKQLQEVSPQSRQRMSWQCCAEVQQLLGYQKRIPKLVQPANQEPTIARRSNSSVAAVTGFWNYLCFGTGPQNVVWTNWEQELLEQFEMCTIDELRNQLQSIFQQYPKGVERLRSQFSEHFLQEFAQLLGFAETASAPSAAQQNHGVFATIKTEVSFQSVFFPLLRLAVIDTQLLNDDVSGDRNVAWRKYPDSAWPSNTEESHQSHALAPPGLKPDSTRGSVLALPLQNVEELFISNAGLALLLSRISPLFKAMGYLQEDYQFKDGGQQYRAAHLLQYAASGKEFTPEVEMPLNKLLCGIPFSEPLPRQIELTTSEKTEVEGFLNIIIEQWGVLKGSKFNYLRTTFLQREGKLSRASDNWKLEVKREAYDRYLLDQLPWNMKLIKHPWMNAHLNISWT